jgi:hypothetical protein
VSNAGLRHLHSLYRPLGFRLHPLPEAVQHVGQNQYGLGRIVRIKATKRGHFLNLRQEQMACPFTVVVFARSQSRGRCARNRWTQHRDSWAGEAAPGPRKNQFEPGQPSNGWCSPLAPPRCRKTTTSKVGATTVPDTFTHRKEASQNHPERCNLRRGGRGSGVDTAGESLFVVHVAPALCFAWFNRGLSLSGWHLY